MAFGVRHAERFQSRCRYPFISLEATLRGLPQSGIAGSLKMELNLGQLLDPVAGLLHDPFDLDHHLLDAGIAATQVGGDRLLARHLLADEEQQTLAQQVDLAGEVVGERAQRDASRGGDATVGNG